MGKTKLGISAGMLGAAVCLVCLLGSGMGLIGVLVLCGYCLLFEDNLWLKRTTVKACVMLFFFAIVVELIDLIPQTVGFIDSIMNLFDEQLEGKALSIIVDKIPAVLYDVVNIARPVFFIVLAFKALGNKTIIIPALDKMLNKHLG